MKTKMTALILAIAMLVVVLSGCGGTPASSSTANESSEASVEAPEVPDVPDAEPAEADASVEKAEYAGPPEGVELQTVTEATAKLLADTVANANAVMSEDFPDDQKDELWSFVESDEYATAIAEVRAEIDANMPDSEQRYDAEGHMVSDKGVVYAYPLDDGHSITAFAVNRGLTSNYVGDYSELISFQLAATETNIDVDFTTVSGDAAETQMNLMFASGDYTDLVSYFSMGYSGTTVSAYENDLIVPLNDYLAEYSPNYNAWLQSSDSYAKAVTADDGNIYAWYSLRSAASIEQGDWVRADLIEKFGIEIPSTVAEMEEYFALCKDEGLKSVISCTAYGFPILSAAFDVPQLGEDSGLGIGLYHEGSEVKSTLLSDEFETYMNKLHEWYEAGYYAPDLVSYTSTDNSAVDTLIYNGETGYMWAGSGHYANYVSQAAVEGWDIVPTPTIVLNEGDTTHFRADTVLQENAGSIVLTTGCDDIEAACRYVDWFYTDMGINQLNYGPEGVTWSWSSDGTRRLFSSAMYQDQVYGLPAAAALMMYNGSTSWASIADPLYNFYFGSSMVPVECQNMWSQNSDSEKYFNTSELSLTAEESEESATIMSDLSTYLEESLIKYLIGDLSMDDWGTFRDTVESMGLQDVVDIYQDAYDRYLQR